MERVVVKIGSSQLVDSKGRLCQEKLQKFAEEIATIHNKKRQVVMVSSGAVAAGFSALGYPSRPSKIQCIQASAAVGQSLLMHAYQQALACFSVNCAQILITRYDLVRHESFRNAFNTLEELLSMGVIPIINENDAVAIDELSFGDNDLLASLVAGAIQAQDLILLTDVDGLYTKNPNKDKSATKLNVVKEITPTIINFAQSSTNPLSKGGMLSKIGACNNALAFGAQAYVGTLHQNQSLQNILKGTGTGTYFRRVEKRNISRRKQWIAFLAESAGEIVVDDGARCAITRNCKSLLPAGVQDIKRNFSCGNVVKVMTSSNILLGKGICNYSSEELSRAMGKKTKDLSDLNKRRTEVIHRDDWVSFHLSR